jgi:hypothetical protein
MLVSVEGEASTEQIYFILVCSDLSSGGKHTFEGTPVDDDHSELRVVFKNGLSAQIRVRPRCFAAEIIPDQARQLTSGRLSDY